jgi:hypothetical protein
MKRIIAALIAAGITTSAISDDYVARARGGDMVRLTQQACPAEILVFVPPDFHAHMQAAFAVIDGKQYRACWINMGDGHIGLVYEDADQARISIEHFKRDGGI